MSASPEYDVEVTHVFEAPPERVYRAFTDPAEFARWYGPPGFPVDPETVELDPRVGGRQQFAMVAEHDPSMRSAFDGRLVEIVENAVLESRGAWDGIPGQSEPWPSSLRVELHEEDGKTRLVLHEGPHPPGAADLGRQSWELMFAKLELVLHS